VSLIIYGTVKVQRQSLEEQRVLHQKKISYNPQHFTVIAQNTKQHCGFGSALPPDELHITPGE